MKLIIECAEQTYSECKKISGLSETAYVIAHGVPYNDSGDLISREALKKDIMAYKTMPEIRKAICEVIDNAQAVEIDEQTVKDAYDQGYADGWKERYGEPDGRPKGEWINREAVSNTIFPFWERYECNQCHKFNGYSNFCPNCGADMRTKESDNETNN